MSDLFKTFEKFIFRDLSFVLGGCTILGCLAYLFNKLPLEELTTFQYFILSGVSYTIGFSIQEIFTLLHIVRTKAIVSPKFLSRNFIVYLIVNGQRK